MSLFDEHVGRLRVYVSHLHEMEKIAINNRERHECSLAELEALPDGTAYYGPYPGDSDASGPEETFCWRCGHSALEHEHYSECPQQ